MSTTAVVSPYDAQKERTRNEMAAREEKAVAGVREEARKARLSPSKLPVCASSKLDLSRGQLTIAASTLDLLMRAAEGVGFTAVTVETTRVTMRRPDNTVVEMERNASGRVELASPRQDLSPAKEIIREYSAMQVYAHLKSRGMTVKARRTSLGEIAIEATREHVTVSTDIRQDGIAVVDVSGMKGQGCQEIITGITRAMEGSQIDTARKKEYLMAVEEKEKVHV